MSAEGEGPFGRRDLIRGKPEWKQVSYNPWGWLLVSPFFAFMIRVWQRAGIIGK
jgi:hypothetical protein